MSAPADNSLYYGDCLDWMRRWDAATVDLIYLDPPFGSNADYNMLYAAVELNIGGYTGWCPTGYTSEVSPP